MVDRRAVSLARSAFFMSSVMRDLSDIGLSREAKRGDSIRPLVSC